MECRVPNQFRMNIKEYIQQNLYPHRKGIMGTVIVHLLALIVLLSVQISRMEVPAAIEIVMALPEPEEIQKAIEEKEKKEEIQRKSAAEEVEQMLRSIAVNENADRSRNSKPESNVQAYIDEVMAELESGENVGKDGRYKPKRDKNFVKDSLQNLRDRREQALDSLKSTFYSGKSSVSYNLKDRYARVLPIPVFKCEFGGTVVVNIAVNPKGAVQKAEVDGAQSQTDDCLWRVATDAAMKSLFNVKADAPALQYGTITYHFVKQ